MNELCNKIRLFSWDIPHQKINRNIPVFVSLVMDEITAETIQLLRSKGVPEEHLVDAAGIVQERIAIHKCTIPEAVDFTMKWVNLTVGNAKKPD